MQTTWTLGLGLQEQVDAVPLLTPCLEQLCREWVEPWLCLSASWGRAAVIAISGRSNHCLKAALCFRGASWSGMAYTQHCACN